MKKRTMKFLYSIAAALFLLLTAALPAEAAQNWMQVYAHVEQMINKGVEQYKNFIVLFFICSSLFNHIIRRFPG